MTSSSKQEYNWKNIRSANCYAFRMVKLAIYTLIFAFACRQALRPDKGVSREVLLGKTKEEDKCPPLSIFLKEITLNNQILRKP
jgi:hypothetical protein